MLASTIAPMLETTALLYSLPLVKPLAKIISQGKSPAIIPWSIIILLITVAPLVFASWRFYFHRQHFPEEENTRDLNDI